MNVERRGRRRTYHHGNLRAALVETAVRLVQREGIEALSLRSVARLAGVSAAAPYRHFADKRALLAAVAEEGFRLLASALRDAARAAFDAMVEGMAEAQQAGVLREGDPRELGLTAWCAMHGLSMLLLDGRLQAVYGRDTDELSAMVGSHLYRGLDRR